MSDLLEDEQFALRLDLMSHRLNQYSNNLSSSLLTNSILSRDLMSLNGEIFEYDTRVAQLNNDFRCAQEFLSKLEALAVRVQFFETQIGLLESHRRNYISRSHKRIASVNEFKDELLDWRTTETTLENLYQEYFHLKKQFIQFSNQTPQQYALSVSRFPSSCHDNDNSILDDSILRTPIQSNIDSFSASYQEKGPQRITANHSRFSPNSSSISTTATSVFDDTTNLRPLRCSSKKKRKSSLQTIESVLNEPPIPFRENDFTNSQRDASLRNFTIGDNSDYHNLFSREEPLADTTMIRYHNKRKSLSVPSFHDLLLNSYQGDLFSSPSVQHTGKDEIPTNDLKTSQRIKKLKHFKSYQGLKISYIDSDNNGKQKLESVPVVKHGEEFDYDYKFPSSPPTTKLSKLLNVKARNTSTQYELKKQTINWLSRIAEDSATAEAAADPSSPKVRRGSATKTPTVPSITPISHSTILHTHTDVSKTSQALLLDMMNKQRENQKKLEDKLLLQKLNETIDSIFDSINNTDLVNSLSKNLSRFRFAKNTSQNEPQSSANSPILYSTTSASNTTTTAYEGDQLLENIESPVNTISSYEESARNLREEKKQWSMMLSKFLLNLPLAHVFDKTNNSNSNEMPAEDGNIFNESQYDDSVEEVDVDPLGDQNSEVVDELQQALVNDLLFD